MMKGTVKFFNTSKGFGFIKDNNSDKEYFIHISKVPNGMVLQENEPVEFEVGPGRKGEEVTSILSVSR